MRRVLAFFFLFLVVFGGWSCAGKKYRRQPLAIPPTMRDQIEVTEEGRIVHKKKKRVKAKFITTYRVYTFLGLRNATGDRSEDWISYAFTLPVKGYFPWDKNRAFIFGTTEFREIFSGLEPAEAYRDLTPEEMKALCYIFQSSRLLYGNYKKEGNGYLFHFYEFCKKSGKVEEWEIRSKTVLEGVKKTFAVLKERWELEPFEKVLPSNEEAFEHAVKGEIYYHFRWMGRAIGELKRAIEADPNFTAAYVTLLEINLLMRRYDEVLKYADMLLKIDPKNGDAIMHGIAAAYQKSDFETMAKYLDLGSKYVPQEPKLYYYKAKYYQVMGDEELYNQYIRQYIHMNPPTMTVYQKAFMNVMQVHPKPLFLLFEKHLYDDWSIGTFPSLVDPENYCYSAKLERNVDYYLDKQKYPWPNSPSAVEKVGSRFYVGEKDNKALLLLTDKGEVKKVVQKNVGQPSGIRFYNGKLYVVDVNMARVEVFDENLEYVGKIEGPEKEGLNHPRGLWVCSLGVFVSDTNNGVIRWFSLDGRQLKIFKLPWITEDLRESNLPDGVAVDEKSRRLYVTDRRYCFIYVFDLDSGKMVKKFGGYGRGPGEFVNPNDAFVYEDKLFVSDGLADSVSVFDLDGNFLGWIRVADREDKVRRMRLRWAEENWRDFSYDEFAKIYETEDANVRSSFYPGGELDIMASPQAITVRDGKLYVVTTYLPRIYVFDLKR